MIEKHGDLWEEEADALVITTNGFVKKNHQAVMGRGVAQQAVRRYPWLPTHLGVRLLQIGNVVHVFEAAKGEPVVVTFPVKHNWWERADPELIKTSVYQLVQTTDLLRWTTVAMPRPGCGNGGLDWADVRPLLVNALDNRFIVVEKNP